jgi:rhodanese-related sulfurtransferase
MSINTISLNDFQRLLQSGGQLNILDVRTPAEFARVHAVGARCVPLDGLDPAAIAAARSGPDDAIYVICHSGARAANACERFQQAGVAEVYSIEGGTAAWERAGLPVEKGKRGAISLERQVRIVAGSLVLIGSILAWTVHRDFLVIPAFVGAGLAFAGITDLCGMGMLLAKLPWNGAPACSP